MGLGGGGGGGGGVPFGNRPSKTRVLRRIDACAPHYTGKIIGYKLLMARCASSIGLKWHA
jgi:hypothetical protein